MKLKLLKLRLALRPKLACEAQCAAPVLFLLLYTELVATPLMVLDLVLSLPVPRVRVEFIPLSIFILIHN